MESRKKAQKKGKLPKKVEENAAQPESKVGEGEDLDDIDFDDDEFSIEEDM